MASVTNRYPTMCLPGERHDDKVNKGCDCNIARRKQRCLRRDQSVCRNIGRQNGNKKHGSLRIQQIQQQSMPEPCTKRILAGHVGRPFILTYPCFPSEPQEISRPCVSQQTEYHWRARCQLGQPHRRCSCKQCQPKRNSCHCCKSRPSAVSCTGQHEPRHIRARGQLNEQCCQQKRCVQVGQHLAFYGTPFASSRLRLALQDCAPIYAT
jgi:hypothetical protein